MTSQWVVRLQLTIYEYGPIRRSAARTDSRKRESEIRGKEDQAIGQDTKRRYIGCCSRQFASSSYDVDPETIQLSRLSFDLTVLRSSIPRNGLFCLRGRLFAANKRTQSVVMAEPQQIYVFDQ